MVKTFKMGHKMELMGISRPKKNLSYLKGKKLKVILENGKENNTR